MLPKAHQMQDSPTIKILKTDSGQRLDHFLSLKFPEHTRSHFTRNIKLGNVKLNNSIVKPGYILQENDLIEINIKPIETNLQPLKLDLDIVFEDDDIIVINKPAGLTVHPGKGTAGDTLVNALIYCSENLALKGLSERPGIVHRLDKHTSGLLVVAKNDLAHGQLQKQFDTKTISRMYWALVWGLPAERSGIVNTCINRSRKDPTKMAVSKSGKEAITHWEILKEYTYFSLLKLRLETGRTHQIRLHMNWMGNPVVGDPDYNGRDSQLSRLPSNLRKRALHLLDLVPHQFLHAKELSFIHPKSNNVVSFQSNLPANLQQALDKLNDLFLLVG